MHSERTVAYLLLGSNLGNRAQFLVDASNRIESDAGEIVALSSVYETQPWGVTGQPAYLNQVVKINTSLTPDRLLTCLLLIEKSLGRVREGVWESRTIDIDILYYGSLVVKSDALEIPHPRLHLRNFVLYPLTEIAADFIHPVFCKSNKELLQESVDDATVEKKPPR